MYVDAANSVEELHCPLLLEKPHSVHHFLIHVSPPFSCLGVRQWETSAFFHCFH